MYEHDFCEYAVKKKIGGRIPCKAGARDARLGGLRGLLFCADPAAVGLFFGAIIFTLFATLMWYLSRFAAIEYEYTQTGAIFDAGVGLQQAVSARAGLGRSEEVCAPGRTV